MAKFFIKRILSAVLTLFIVCTLTFFLMNLIPGGPFMSEKTTEKTLAIINEKYGLDKPLTEQYVNYMNRLIHGDLGISYKRQGFTVNQIIAEKFPISASLGGCAMAFALVIGVSLGTLAAANRNRLIDRVAMVVCTLGISVPSFVIGTLLLYLLGVNLKLLPIVGLTSPLHYIMPAIALSAQPLSYITRLMRSNMLDVIDQDYIKTARSKGLSSRVVLFKHALKNSILPIVTYLGPMTAQVVTGGFVVERIFSIPGLGGYFVSSISNRDYPMIMGTTIFLATLVIAANLIVDVLYRVIDPRIKYN